ncbi:MAG: hypothetical protein KGN78_04525 [Actinomycetales bacterium]|nr:hypothetical protein [Actinomycetales bacterium]
MTITEHGRPQAALISADHLDFREETLRVLSDPELHTQVRASRAEREQTAQLIKGQAPAWTDAASDGVADRADGDRLYGALGTPRRRRRPL